MTPWPDDPYSRPDGGYRTPSRQRARHRGAPDPVDSYTPSWARESTEPLQSSAPVAYSDSSGWTSDPEPDRADGGRHHRADAAAGPASGSDRPGRRRVAPEVTWDSTGEYWRGPGGAADEAAGGESSDDGWRSAGGTAGWRRDDATGGTRSGGTRSGATDTGATGGRGRRRAADRHSDEVDDWAAAAPTSGWVGAAPTSGWIGAAPTTGAGAAPTSGGWISEAPTSGGWAAAAPTTGAGANSGLLGDRSTTSRQGRRRRADPDDDPTATPRSGWGVGAADAPSGETGRWGRADTPVGWRERADEAGSGRWGRADDREPGPPVDPPQRAPGRRRRAEPAGWEPGDPSGSVPPAGRRRSRHSAAEDPTEVAERPDAIPSSGPGQGTEQSGATARWVRSPGEADSGGGTGRRSRSADPLPGPAGPGARRRQREPDAEPVRRSRDAGPVRRVGEERGAPGRHSDPGPERRGDAGSAGWHADAGPWDRLTDTGMLDRVTDSEPPGGPATGRRRDRSTDTGQWDGFTDTGQWDRFTDTTEWRHGELAGLARGAETGRDDPTDGGSRDPGRTEADGADTFWSGTRLAGDDPRWMGIPDSAPRSPAVAYPPPARPVSPARSAPTRRPAAAPGGGRAGTTNPARSAGTAGSARSVSGAGMPTRRAPSGTLLTSATRTGRPSPLSRRLEDDLLDPQPSGPLTAVLYTAAWYAVAVLAVFVWILTLDASVPVDCVPGVSGACESERGQAMSALLAAVPRFLAALATGLVVAALMRWFNRTWRAVTIGLSAAVVGGGLSTVIFSALSGQPIG
ncbi:hypothetical protein GCM10022225_81700 [Plantactinospora mayteni]|uniref:hypothetical protein n=1 Tax=Plantactinospora mayteni TaxID=566021 RepID=UPI0019407945|nr:hypothetical protein [Plantactinospora mayteni]